MGGSKSLAVLSVLGLVVAIAVPLVSGTASGSLKVGQLIHEVYQLLAAHPYHSVIGGMILYLAVLISISRYTSKGSAAQHEQIKQQYEQYQRFQHYRRLHNYWQQHPEAMAEQQQQQQQQHAEGQSRTEQQQSQKWSGCMGFGSIKPLPEGCQGAVKEVLQAMDFYEVLDVSWNNVNPASLKAARKARALAVHPDKVNIAGAALAGSRVNMAYEALSDPQIRQEYDRWLSKQF